MTSPQNKEGVPPFNSKHETSPSLEQRADAVYETLTSLRKNIKQADILQQINNLLATFDTTLLIYEDADQHEKEKGSQFASVIDEAEKFIQRLSTITQENISPTEMGHEAATLYAARILTALEQAKQNAMSPQEQQNIEHHIQDIMKADEAYTPTPEDEDVVSSAPTNEELPLFTAARKGEQFLTQMRKEKEAAEQPVERSKTHEAAYARLQEILQQLAAQGISLPADTNLQRDIQTAEKNANPNTLRKKKNKRTAEQKNITLLNKLIGQLETLLAPPQEPVSDRERHQVFLALDAARVQDASEKQLDAIWRAANDAANEITGVTVQIALTAAGRIAKEKNPNAVTKNAIVETIAHDAEATRKPRGPEADIKTEIIHVNKVGTNETLPLQKALRDLTDTLEGVELTEVKLPRKLRKTIKKLQQEARYTADTDAEKMAKAIEQVIIEIQAVGTQQINNTKPGISKKRGKLATWGLAAVGTVAAIFSWMKKDQPIEGSAGDIESNKAKAAANVQKEHTDEGVQFHHYDEGLTITSEIATEEMQNIPDTGSKDAELLAMTPEEFEHYKKLKEAGVDEQVARGNTDVTHGSQDAGLLAMSKTEYATHRQTRQEKRQSQITQPDISLERTQNTTALNNIHVELSTGDEADDSQDALTSPQEKVPAQQTKETNKATTIDGRYEIKKGQGVLHAFASLLGNGGRERVTQKLMEATNLTDAKKGDALFKTWENEQLEHNGVNPKTLKYKRGVRVKPGAHYVLAFTAEGPTIALEDKIESEQRELGEVSQTHIVKQGDTPIGVIDGFLKDTSIHHAIIDWERTHNHATDTDENITHSWRNKQLQDNGFSITKKSTQNPAFTPGMRVELRTDREGQLGVFVKIEPAEKEATDAALDTEEAHTDMQKNPEVLFAGEQYAVGEKVMYKTKKGEWRPYTIADGGENGHIQLWSTKLTKSGERSNKKFAISPAQKENIVRGEMHDGLIIEEKGAGGYTLHVGQSDHYTAEQALANLILREEFDDNQDKYEDAFQKAQTLLEQATEEGIVDTDDPLTVHTTVEEQIQHMTVNRNGPNGWQIESIKQ